MYHNKLKFNNPNEDFCVGIYCHKLMRVSIIDDKEVEDGFSTRLIIGFLIFSWEIIW